jgi:hypothetical protein
MSNRFLQTIHPLFAATLVGCSILGVSVQAQISGRHASMVVAAAENSDKLAAKALQLLQRKSHAEAVEVLTQAIANYRDGGNMKLATLYGLRGAAYLALATDGGSRVEQVDPAILNLAKADLDKTTGVETNGIAFAKTQAIANQLLSSATSQSPQAIVDQLAGATSGNVANNKPKQPIAAQSQANASPAPVPRPISKAPVGQVTTLPKNASIQPQPFSKVVQFKYEDFRAQYHTLTDVERFVKVKAGPLKVELIGSPNDPYYLIGFFGYLKMPGNPCLVAGSKRASAGIPGTFHPYQVECNISEDTVARLTISSHTSNIIFGRFTSNGMRPLTQAEMKEYYPQDIPKKIIEGSECSTDRVFGASNCKNIRMQVPEY